MVLSVKRLPLRLFYVYKISVEWCSMKDIELLSEWMDSKFKIGPFRFGLDGLIGLIPGVGDLATSLVSFYIVIRAALLGASFSVILRMLLNILIEYLVGLTPILGNIFDFIWKSNIKNIELFRKYKASPRPTAKKSGFVILSVFGTVLFLCLFFIYITFKVLVALLSLIL